MIKSSISMEKVIKLGALPLRWSMTPIKRNVPKTGKLWMAELILHSNMFVMMVLSGWQQKMMFLQVWDVRITRRVNSRF